jgi:hypothetical protein
MLFYPLRKALIAGLFSALLLPAYQAESAQVWVPRPVTKHMTCLVLDGKYIFAGTAEEGTLFRSADRGVTWTPVTGLQGPWQCNCGAAQSANIMLGGPSGVLRSTDFGVSWSLISATRGLSVTHVAINGSAKPSSVYITAGTNGGKNSAIWKSTDGAITWTALTGVPSASQTLWLQVDPRDSKHLIVAGDGLWASYDGGSTFASVSIPQFDQALLPAGVTAAMADRVWSVAIDTASPRVYVGSAYKGVARSLDGGRSYAWINGGLTGFALQRVAKIIIDDHNADDLILISNGGVYRSLHAGNGWSDLTGNLDTLGPFGHLPQLLDALRIGNVLLVATPSGLFSTEVN